MLHAQASPLRQSRVCNLTLGLENCAVPAGTAQVRRHVRRLELSLCQRARALCVDSGLVRRLNPRWCIIQIAPQSRFDILKFCTFVMVLWHGRRVAARDVAGVMSVKSEPERHNEASIQFLFIFCVIPVIVKLAR